jgi:hypothetical protein
MFMRRFWLTAAASFIVGFAHAGSSPWAPDSFSSNAKFSVNGEVFSVSSAVAFVEPRSVAPGYAWLRIYFYPFPITAEDITGVTDRATEAVQKKWNSKRNQWHAAIQLTLDKEFKVWQVDMSVPGHTCTIAYLEPDLKSFLQDYHFDGKGLKLKSKGSHLCDMKSLGMPNQKFDWEVDLNTAVFEKANSKARE